MYSVVALKKTVLKTAKRDIHPPRSCDIILMSSRLRAEKFEKKWPGNGPKEMGEAHSITMCHMLSGIAMMLISY